MHLKDLISIIDGTVFTNNTYNQCQEIKYAFSCDLMSDAILLLGNIPTEVCNESFLSTGLPTIQTIKTAEILDMKVILVVRGKQPTKQIIDLAESKDMIIIGTKLTSFESSGRLYMNGIKAMLNFYNDPNLEDKNL